MLVYYYDRLIISICNTACAITQALENNFLISKLWNYVFVRKMRRLENTSSYYNFLIFITQYSSKFIFFLNSCQCKLAKNLIEFTKIFFNKTFVKMDYAGRLIISDLLNLSSSNWRFFGKYQFSQNKTT